LWTKKVTLPLGAVAELRWMNIIEVLASPKDTLIGPGAAEGAAEVVGSAAMVPNPPGAAVFVPRLHAGKATRAPSTTTNVTLRIRASFDIAKSMAILRRSDQVERPAVVESFGPAVRSGDPGVTLCPDIHCR
jgi:hypothetical protein